MKLDILFNIALCISTLFHGAIIVRPERAKREEPLRGYRAPTVEYIRVPEEFNLRKQDQQQGQGRKETLSRDQLEPVKMVAEDAAPPPFPSEAQEFTEKEGLRRAPTVKSDEFITKPVFEKSDAITIRKKITLPEVAQDEKIDNPAYDNYYQMVRERIKRAAYRSYTGREEGEIMLSFIVSSAGELKAVKLLEEKSSSSEYLRSVADSSVRAASPFPPFPAEVSYAELSFNIAITFEIE